MSSKDRFDLMNLEKEAIAELGEPLRTFKPDTNNLIAGVLLCLLAVLTGGGLIIWGITKVVANGGDLPAFAQKEFSWFAVALVVLGGLFLIAMGFMFFWFVQSLVSVRVVICPKGFFTFGSEGVDVFCWDEICRVREYVEPQYLPMQGVVKHVVPMNKPRCIAVDRKDGTSFKFDGNVVMRVDELAELIQAKMQERGVPWLFVNESEFMDEPAPESETENLRNEIERYTQLIKAEPNNANAHFSRAECFFELDDFAATLRDYDAGIRLDPNDSRSFVNRGVCHRKLGNNEKALEDFDQAIRMTGILAAYFNRANVRVDQGEFELAVSNYSAVIEKVPNFRAAYLCRARAYVELQQLKNAIADFSATIELDPIDANTHEERAEVYEQIGKTEEAQADRQRAQQLAAGSAT